MPDFNESTVKDAALTCFGKLGFAVERGPQMAPGEAAVEQTSFGELLLLGQLVASNPLNI